MKRLLVLSLFLSLLFGSNAFAETIIIGSWNIENLHHKNDFKLRSFGTKRQNVDFDLLRSYANRFGRQSDPADIIALQEIGTRAGLERIFPPSDYLILMSSRHENDNAEEEEGEIYTAIAVRKNRGISVVKQDDLEELAIKHTDGRPVRAGTAALLDVNGTKLWFMSVHLKSSCSHVKKAHTSTRDDCETLWKQHMPLLDWIKQKREAKIPFVIAGDFNRRFRQFQNQGPFWKAINGGEPDEDLKDALLSQHPSLVTRKCPTRRGSSTQPIDWILLDAGVAHWFVEGSFWERRYRRADISKADGGLSDHCPISINIEIE
ncbi:MAG: endonuclease/exonuclease/phosphatase family protein [Hyphomicrobiaceae bacterium]|nr:endonuclease/exonuclease/phosphatase family protein [Hyphomicrobiaceae bacterium]